MSPSWSVLADGKQREFGSIKVGRLDEAYKLYGESFFSRDHAHIKPAQMWSDSLSLPNEASARWESVDHPFLGHHDQ